MTIIGYNFVNNNKNNIDLIINGKSYALNQYANLKKGENTIKLIIKNELTDLSWMFRGLNYNIKNIELKNLDVSKVKSFMGMFYDCSWLSNLNGLLKWNISKGRNFSHLFSGCSSLSNINGLKNWNVSNGANFSSMLYDCASLSDIKSLQNWNILNGKDLCLEIIYYYLI